MIKHPVFLLPITGVFIQAWILATALIAGKNLPPVRFTVRDTLIIITFLMFVDFLRQHGAKRNKVYLPILVFLVIYRANSQTYKWMRKTILWIKGTAALQTLILWHVGVISFLNCVLYTVIVVALYFAIDVVIAYRDYHKKLPSPTQERVTSYVPKT